jgi:ABC-type glycerol-3-phosphate transport system substrate-binding protein
MKSKRVVLGLLLSIALLLAPTYAAFADDYIPLPGVLGPDEVDFGGETVTLVGIDFENARWEWGAFHDTFMQRVAEAEDLFNCKIVNLARITDAELLARILAGDSTADIIYGQQHRSIGYFKLVSEGMLYPVGDFLPDEYYEALGKADKAVHDRLAYQGKRYGFGVYHGDINHSMTIWAYNKSMLEREGQPDPWDLWLAGEWTYDAFEKIATAVTRDTDGDGVTDQWGSTDLTANFRNVIRFLPTNGVEVARVDENGKYIFNLDSPAAIEALNIYMRWRQAGIFTNAKFEHGRVAFNGAHIAGHRFAKQTLQDEYGFVPPPKGPSADRHYYPTFGFEITVLPGNVKNPQGLVALLSYLIRPDDSWVEQREQALMDYSVTKQEHWEMIQAAIEEFAGEGDLFDSTSLWDMLNAPIMNSVSGSQGAAAAMAAVKPQAQAWLDDLFEQ